MISRIDHIQLRVRDVNEEVVFLEKLGMKILKWNKSHNGVFMIFPDYERPYIKLVAAKEGHPVGLDHVSFNLTDGVTERERLKQAGIVFKANGEGKYIEAENHEVSNMLDPSGLSWQLTEDL